MPEGDGLSMMITNEDVELIQAVFEEYREEIGKDFIVDRAFIEKFNLKRYG